MKCMKEAKPDSPSSITGIVLSGGKSSRMGIDKGLMKINGMTMTTHAVNVLIGICDRIIIIANDEQYEDLGYPVYHDIVKEQGPAGGLYTGLHYVETEWNILIACDMPNLKPDLIKYLIGNIDQDMIAVVPELKGRAQPMCAVYHKDYYNALQESMQNGMLTMRYILKQNRTKYLPITDNLPFYSDDLFENLNTPESVKMFRKKGSEK
jgi:molybdenum cofactor guanylyltransferase